MNVEAIFSILTRIVLFKLLIPCNSTENKEYKTTLANLVFCHREKGNVNDCSYLLVNRNDNLPSIEVAFKLADVFDVSVDYLLGKGKHASYDNETVKRLEDIEHLDPQTKNTLFTIIDTFLRDSKARLAYK